uniref:Prefoldin subunit alpha n=1 Tax=Aegilops tauschii subsp. strangulata TaxID=200361 RepID=A0A453GEP6_AEGTS
ADLARVQGFFADNAALVNLVQRLPDELSHQIMVPFGGAAFFPGSLIHTNELLVLLGDGYYADRSAKQTTEILHRRGMELEAQMEAIKATISDLEAEAKFFESTAAEASEGLVEIREEYDEEDTEILSSKTG